MTFIDSIRSVMQATARPAPRYAAESGPTNDVSLAACTLLLDIAYADGEFTAPERAQIESVLGTHFGLSAEAGRALIALAEQERARAVDYFHFTNLLQREYDLDQRIALAEVMWGLVLADETIAEREYYLTRKIANLLDLPPACLSQAKKAAENRH